MVQKLIVISSSENSLLKEYLKIQQKARYRKESGLFVVEGEKEIKFALAQGYEIDYLFIKQDSQALKYVPEYKQRVVVKRNFAKMVYRENTIQFAAIFRQKIHDLEHFKPQRSENLILLEGIEKPGNLGAILRSVDASGIDAVLLTDSTVDLYNPNVIRSSVGCVFTKPIAICTNEEALNWCKKHQLSVIVTHIDAEKLWWETDLRKPVVIVLGSEAWGVSKFWDKYADERIKLPMSGINDSLNVSVAAGIVLYEIVRQQSEGQASG